MIRQFSQADVLFLLSAAQYTIVLSLVTLIGGGLVGALVALARTSRRHTVRAISGAYVQTIQGTPLLMQLFIAYFIPSTFGLSIDAWFAAVVGLSVNASGFLGEIWRGAIISVPSGQRDAASALGLRFTQQMRLVILPQAARISLPPTVGFSVQLIKGTSLAAIIGFTELTRAAQLTINTTHRPFLIFMIVAVIYFAMCWPLSLLSRALEERLAQPSGR